MIKVGSGDISKIMLGEVPVTKVYRGSEVVWSASKQYGGIEVLFDDAAYGNLNNTIDNYVYNQNTFVCTVVDSQNETKKSIEFGYTTGKPHMSALYMRAFNDTTAKSADYWSMPSNVDFRTISTVGRYYTFTIEKANAQYFYVLDSTTQQYLLKGSAVE